MEEKKPNYFIRADIRSFFKSILHYKLIQDIKQHYDDTKVQAMLKEIFTNPIDTPRGTKNPVNGIALRGPLSQFFSGIYLKPLDDAFNAMDVTFIRYQDDILILCQTKRQLNRCRRKMMEVLHERRLSLSRKKTRMGCIKSGFHFLGIKYLGTQTLDNTNADHSSNDSVIASRSDHDLNVIGGGVATSDQQQNELTRIVPHARTLRKAREQVKVMVATGFSTRKIRNYLHLWTAWWANTTELWTYEELLEWFIRACWDIQPAVIAAGLLQRRAITLSSSRSSVTVVQAAG